MIEKLLNSLAVPSFELSIILSEINSFLNEINDQVFAARTVHELLWGYEDPILGDLKNFTLKLDKALKEHGFNFTIPSVNPIIKLQVLRDVNIFNPYRLNLYVRHENKYHTESK